MLKFDDNFTNNRIAGLHLKEKERITEARAMQAGFDYVNLHGYSINPVALAIIPEEKAYAGSMICFSIKKHDITVAATNPGDPKTQAVLEELVAQHYKLTIYMCSQDSLDHSWKMYADIAKSTVSKKGVFEMSPEDITRLMNKIKTKDDVAVILKEINGINNNRRISETLELMFAGGLALRASDIHIEPEANSIRLRYRLSGVLHDIADIDSYIYGRIISRLKILSGMILNAKQEAQDGRFTFSTSDRQVEVRSSIIPGAVAESVVMRLLDPTVASFSLDKIHLNPYIKEIVEQHLKKPNGLILTTGPTGSGKTTALYAFLRETHTEGVKIITIENPVEYKLDGIVQTQTGEDYTFASGLRAILRQDPDIIMVGEIRDPEVAETAIHAAQTGHLVFSTLHTNSAVAGFPRLIDLGVDPRIIGSSVNLIMGQRLIRTLCDDCKKSYEASTEETRLVNYIMAEHPYPIPVPSPLIIHKAAGCETCGNSGFSGRMGIFEAVAMDKAVEEAILNDPREIVILEAAKAQKIPTMIQDGMEKIIKGETSLNELERVIEFPLLTDDSEVIETEKTPASSEDDFLSHVI